MAVEHRPVDEEEPLLRAPLASRSGRRSRRASSGPARGSATWECRRTRAGRARASALPGPKTTHVVPSAHAIARPRSTRSARAPSKIRAKTGSPGSTARRRASLDLVPRDEGAASVLQLDVDVVRRERSRRGMRQRRPKGAPPARRSRHARPHPRYLGGERLESAARPHRRRPGTEGWGRSSRDGRSRRSIVNAALHEKSRRPERLARRRFVVLDEPGARDELDVSPASSLCLCGEPRLLQAADEEPVDVHPDGPTPVAPGIECGARLGGRGHGPRRLRRRAEAIGRPERLVEETPSLRRARHPAVEREEAIDRLATRLVDVVLRVQRSLLVPALRQRRADPLRSFACPTPLAPSSRQSPARSSSAVARIELRVRSTKTNGSSSSESGRYPRSRRCSTR